MRDGSDKARFNWKILFRSGHTRLHGEITDAAEIYIFRCTYALATYLEASLRRKYSTNIIQALGALIEVRFCIYIYRSHEAPLSRELHLEIHWKGTRIYHFFNLEFCQIFKLNALFSMKRRTLCHAQIRSIEAYPLLDGVTTAALKRTRYKHCNSPPFA